MTDDKLIPPARLKVNRGRSRLYAPPEKTPESAATTVIGATSPEKTPESAATTIISATSPEKTPESAATTIISGALPDPAESDQSGEAGAPVADPEQPPAAKPAAQRAAALSRIKRYSALAGAAGALPVPVFDMLAAAALQLKMIHELSGIYHVGFSEQRAKAAVAALLGGVQTGLFAKSLFKYVPFVGYPLMAASSALTAGAVTYALGRVFLYHFDLGGSLLDFDPRKLRGYFHSQLKKRRSED